jgi:hypothetical protein
LKILEDATQPVMMPTELPPGVECHPFSFLRYVLRDNSPYPIPLVSQALDPQDEINDARSKIAIHRKRFNRKYSAVDGQVDEDELDKLEVGEDGTIIKVRAHSAIDAIQDAQLDPTTYQEVALLNQDMIEIMGSGDEARAIAGSDSATEAGIIDKRMDIREGDKLSLVQDFVIDSAANMDKLVKAHITQDEAVQISGPRGEVWETVRAEDYEDIAGEFEYSVNVGSTIARLPQLERAQWMAFLQVLRDFPHLLTQPRLMKRMAEMHHIEDEQMLDDLFQLGQQILGGSVPMPGGGGSQAGVPGANPIAAVAGAAGGVTGGNTNGGGSPVPSSVT